MRERDFDRKRERKWERKSRKKDKERMKFWQAWKSEREREVWGGVSGLGYIDIECKQNESEREVKF